VTVGELEEAWAAIEVPSQISALGGRRPAGDAPEGVLVALDHHGNRHLLVEAPPDSRSPSMRAVKGLTVEIADLQVGDLPVRSYFDVACTEPSLNRNFANVAVEIIDRLGAEGGDPRLLLERTFSRWRWFWGSPGGDLSDTEAVGLFAELWFLEHWIGPVSGASIATWTGPARDRHDFKCPTASVEVKGTRARSDGSATHRITNLDQLASPETGSLYLFSLRVSPDPIGGNSLKKSVDRLRGQLAERPEELHALEDRLALAGYAVAASESYDAPLRVTAEELFEVGEGFPRLTPGTFPEGPPAGVDNVTYTLDLAACGNWRIATKPTDPAAETLRSALLEATY
jgi:hypothetical protein